MATLMQLIQGVVAGVSILAVGVGFLYLASLGGGVVNVVLDGTVVEISASHPAERDPAPPLTTAAETVEAEGDTGAEVAEASVVAREAPRLPDPPPIPDAVVLDYYNLIAPDLSATLISLGRLSLLLENPRPEEEGWRSDITQLIDVVEGGYEQLLLVRPPSDAAALHDFLMDATERCLGVTGSLTGDLVQTPPDLFPLVGRTLRHCTEEAKAVAEQIN